MICEKCGAEILDDSDFCLKCGAAVKHSVEKSTAGEDESIPGDDITAEQDNAELMCTIEKSTDLLAELNYIYFEQYTVGHTEIAGDFEKELALIKQLEAVSGSAVQYGASAEYSGDRSQLCTLTGDLPLDVNAAMLLDSVGLLDLDYYYSTPEPVPTAEPTPKTVDTDKYASVKEFLNDPDVRAEMNQLIENMVAEDDSMSVSVEGSDNALTYIFAYTDAALEDVDVSALCIALEEGLDSETSTYVNIADSLVSIVDANNISVIVIFTKADGSILVRREFKPSE